MMREVCLMMALVALGFTNDVLAAERGFRVDFARGKWNAEDWIRVKSARWDYMGAFVQNEDHIANACPDLSDEEIYKNHVCDVYSSMVCKNKIKAKARISCTMSFDHLMAPLVVIAPSLAKDAQGRAEYREHHEVVLYNEGINVWRYTWVDGKPFWRLVAFLRRPYEAKRRYTLDIELEKRKGQIQMTICCDGSKFGYADASLSEEFYAGVTGCEGRNRFYDFSVTTLLGALPAAADGEH